ncbi:hypothetical protein, partial [Frankia nepalensis]|uniref:hypothetical protein n=1 Tax=Frankia nepalensis TaxID=1836974 RepID=UPI001EE3DCC2
ASLDAPRLLLHARLESRLSDGLVLRSGRFTGYRTARPEVEPSGSTQGVFSTFLPSSLVDVGGFRRELSGSSEDPVATLGPSLSGKEVVSVSG